MSFEVFHSADFAFACHAFSDCSASVWTSQNSLNIFFEIILISENIVRYRFGIKFYFWAKRIRRSAAPTKIDTFAEKSRAQKKSATRHPSFLGLHLQFFNYLCDVGAALAAQHELMCG